MDYVTLDLILAIAHHLLIFALAAIVAYQIGTVRMGMNADAVARVAKVDAFLGLIAVAIIAVGLTRATYAAKGWEYYSANHWFWAKIGAFAILGLLSVMPTIAFLRWRRSAKANSAFTPPEREVRTVRRHLWMEAGVFAFILAFAATMARIQ